MKIIFNEDLAGVKSATEKSNELLKNVEFYKAIANHPNFDLSTASPKIIANLLERSELEFKVEIFYPNGLQLIKYRKTLAYTDENHPNTLFLNFRKLNREVESIVATIIHESIHALDDNEEEYTFGHGNNSSVGKDNTAPYWIGNLAYRILKNNHNAPLLVFDQIEEDTIA